MNYDILLGIGAGLMIGGTVLLYSGKRLVKNAVDKAVKYFSTYQMFLVVLTLFQLFPNVVDSPNFLQRSFRLIKLGIGMNIMVVRRVKHLREGFTIDMNRPFQIHSHSGRVSVYVQLHNFTLFNTESPIKARRAWGSKGVKQTTITSDYRKRGYIYYDTVQPNAV